MASPVPVLAPRVEGSTLKYSEKAEMHSSTVYFSQIPVWQTTDITILVKRKDKFYCTQDVHCVAGEERGSVWQPSGDQEQHSTTSGQPNFLKFLVLSFLTTINT